MISKLIDVWYSDRDYYSLSTLRQGKALMYKLYKQGKTGLRMYYEIVDLEDDEKTKRYIYYFDKGKLKSDDVSGY